MSVRKLVVILVGLNLDPLSLLVLYITESLFIDTNLAKVVKERCNNKALLTILR